MSDYDAYVDYSTIYLVDVAKTKDQIASSNSFPKTEVRKFSQKG